MNPLLKALQPYRAKLDRDLVFSLHQQEKSAVVAHCLVAITLFFLLRTQVPGVTLSLWIASVIGLSILRGLRALRIDQKENPTDAKVIKRRLWAHFAIVCSCGLAWSLGFLIAIPAAPPAI